ncbi:hypothetical protein M427DRAFT_46147 [Gonapodya prolifera JEL478]|uniref:Uncharacterized protein n=1 Tax=Gonapodya prolifera (strain JEL478) TaxID=1344416 RepID=A0A139A7B6_GONPJ|nr:hypothetical protein M427DRAFT_46147 [Gonapodya prolifera JEL478]|eukprot:KXS12687.1 hypothetical protein M427DRAFT_46147 [Gonapodya prolifera JEL478]
MAYRGTQIAVPPIFRLARQALCGKEGVIGMSMLQAMGPQIFTIPWPSFILAQGDLPSTKNLLPVEKLDPSDTKYTTRLVTSSRRAERLRFDILASAVPTTPMASSVFGRSSRFRGSFPWENIKSFTIDLSFSRLRENSYRGLCRWNGKRVT